MMSKMELRKLREVLEESRARYLYLSNASFTPVEEKSKFSDYAEVCESALREMNQTIREEQPEHDQEQGTIVKKVKV